MGRLPFAHLPNAWLLLALVLQVLSYPFLDHGGRAVIAVFDLAILALALRASRAGGHETRLGYVLVVPAMVLHAADALGGGPVGWYPPLWSPGPSSMGSSSSACCATCCATRS